jgi:hypothetical protein
MAKKATPVVVVAGAVLGAVVVFQLVKRARRRTVWRLPAPDSRAPSLVRVVLGAALRSVVRALAARMVEQAAARLVEAGEEHEPDAGVPSPS